MSVNTISANQVQRMLSANKFSLIIDLRDYYDYSRGHLPNAINIQTNEILNRMNQFKQYKNENILLYCQYGVQSVSAGKALIVNGFKKIYSLNGGLDNYNYELY